MNCDCNLINEKAIEKVKESMFDEAINNDMADFFKSVGDLTRMKIINALSIEELCVCDLAHVLGMSQSAISHQLKTLKQSKLVKFRKEGKVVYYSLDDEHVLSILKVAHNHVTHK